MWKPDCLLLIAKAVADLINSEPRSPSPQELQNVLRGGYFTMYVVMGGGTIDHCRVAEPSALATSAPSLPQVLQALGRVWGG